MRDEPEIARAKGLLFHGAVVKAAENIRTLDALAILGHIAGAVIAHSGVKTEAASIYARAMRAGYKANSK